MDEIPSYDPDLAEANGPTSLVLSGSELITMTESQWKQVLTVRSCLSSLGSSLTDVIQFDEVVFARTVSLFLAFQQTPCADTPRKTSLRNRSSKLSARTKTRPARSQ